MQRKRAKYLALVATMLVVAYFLEPVYVFFAEISVPDQSKCRLEGLPGDPKCTPRPSESGTVKIIQLTDLGELVDRCQLTDVLFELNWDRPLISRRDFNVAVKYGAVQKPKFVVLYIHGWHNNARQNHGDLDKFKSLIELLAKSKENHQVVGIYVSWEANSDIPIWHYLDFWQKMGVADRISASGSVTSIISAVSSILSRSNNNSQLVAIGHSFGARILMASTLQSTIAATQKSHPGRPHASYRNITGLSQAIIFLNPAFEAAYFTPIAAFNRREEKFATGQKPLLISISASNDYATTYAFPLGQWFAWRTAKKERYTLGNYEEFWTHSLTTADVNECSTSSPAISLTEQYNKSTICLKRVKYNAGNPFLVVRADEEILSGHGGIWEDRFSNWLFGYIDALGLDGQTKINEPETIAARFCESLAPTNTRASRSTLP